MLTSVTSVSSRRSAPRSRAAPRSSGSTVFWSAMQNAEGLACAAAGSGSGSNSHSQSPDRTWQRGHAGVAGEGPGRQDARDAVRGQEHRGSQPGVTPADDQHAGELPPRGVRSPFTIIDSSVIASWSRLPGVAW
jgi:hypothetical protein